MNQLDAVASESYQLQPATLEHQETETKELDLTEPEKCNSETETLPKDIPETECSELPPASEVSAELNEPHSEEEDKFSDFDPAALPEPDPEISQNSFQTELITTPGEERGNLAFVKGNDNHPSEDYMSDVSSGEDFLSASHDQSGPEDGEVSEAEEAKSSKPSEVTTECDTATDSNVEKPEHQLIDSNKSPTHIGEETKGEPKDLKDVNNCLGSEKQANIEKRAITTNVLIDNASPIDDEDLESLEDFDQDIETENSQKAIETDKSVVLESKESDEKIGSTLICEEEKSSVENNNKQSENLSESVTECDNLNPEPIDSSPDLTTCEEEVIENSVSSIEAVQKNSDVTGKIDLFVFRLYQNIKLAIIIMIFNPLNLFRFVGADFAENKKENSVFANIVNLPPTEEVSDNELENIDDFNEENEKSNLENQSHDHNDIASSTLNSQFDHNNHRNTFSHQKESTVSGLAHNSNISKIDNSNQLLDTEHNRPQFSKTQKVNAFSPHSPVSSPEINDLEDIGSNSPSAFGYKSDSLQPYIASHFEQTHYSSHTSHRLIDGSENQQKLYDQESNQGSYQLQQRYQHYSNSETEIRSPERINLFNTQNHKRNRANEQYTRSPIGEDFVTHFETETMARDRHSNSHRSEHYESREKSRNHKDSENDHYEANSKYSRRERSISSDRNSYQDKSDIMHKRRDKKSKKAKKNKKDKKYRDYRTSKKGSKGDDDYNDMDGSPFSSDPDIEGRNSRGSYRHTSRSRNRTGK